jgi:hypothetical protein
MEESTNKKMAPDMNDEGKEKGGRGSRIYNSSAGRGLIRVFIGGFINAVIIMSKRS